jgi:hypothetical protein
VTYFINHLSLAGGVIPALEGEMRLIFKEGERSCCECGREFVPRGEADAGGEIYCMCPEHARYTFAEIAEEKAKQAENNAKWRKGK